MADTQNIFSEFHDPVRQELIQKITQQDPTLITVPRATHLYLWFSEISVLKDLVETGSPLPESASEFITGIFGDHKQQPNLNWTPETYDTSRDKTPGHAALKRDNYQCVLTGHSLFSLDVSHIVPFKLNASEARVAWSQLKSYWGEAKANAWREEIQGKDDDLNSEQVYNMICLQYAVHLYWNMPICAFRPISINDAKTSMEIAFHWLPLPDHSIHPSDLVPLNKHPYPEPPTGFTGTPGQNILIFDLETTSIIRSGKIFTLTTDDAEKRPLPSFQLLEMKWHLARISAMQGSDEDEDSTSDFSQFS